MTRNNSEEWGITIATRIPQEWKKTLEEHVVGGKNEFTNFSEYLRHLVRADMKRRGIL